MDLIGYVRVSAEHQLDGYGPDSQRQDIQRWADNNGHRIKHWMVEDVTGKVGAEEREEFERILALLSEDFADGVVVARLDRLARQLTVQEALLGLIWSRNKKVFASDTGDIEEDDPDDPMRTAMRQMAGVFAELERKMITARMRKGKRAKKKRGLYIGGNVPWGFRHDTETDMIVVDPDYEHALRRIIELEADEVDMTASARTLNAEGILRLNGVRWNGESVKRTRAHIRKYAPELVASDA